MYPVTASIACKVEAGERTVSGVTVPSLSAMFKVIVKHSDVLKQFLCMFYIHDVVVNNSCGNATKKLTVCIESPHGGISLDIRLRYSGVLFEAFKRVIEGITQGSEWDLKLKHLFFF